MALILVIDDAFTVRDLVCRMLADAQHSVIEANDGETGLALFQERHPALVITDLIMPKMEGIETIQRLRQAKPDAKIIAMSAKGKLYLGAAQKLGADAALSKPFQPAELLAVVDRLLASA